MKCNFVVGQRVVCIAAGDWSSWRSLVWSRAGLVIITPRNGDKLTIREIYTDNKDGVGLRFVEIRNPISSWHHIEFGFPFWEFAPLNERKTDISVFQKMLTDDRVLA